MKIGEIRYKELNGEKYREKCISINGIKVIVILPQNMIHSQINHTKVWSFLRRTPNLKVLESAKVNMDRRSKWFGQSLLKTVGIKFRLQSLCDIYSQDFPKTNKRTSANPKTLTENNHLTNRRWLKWSDLNILIQKIIRLKVRLQLLKQDIIASSTSIITLFGYPSIENVSLQGE